MLESNLLRIDFDRIVDVLELAFLVVTVLEEAAASTKSIASTASAAKFAAAAEFVASWCAATAAEAAAVAAEARCKITT